MVLYQIPTKSCHFFYLYPHLQKAESPLDSSIFNPKLLLINLRRQHSSLAKRTPAAVYGLDNDKDYGMIKPDGGRSAIGAAMVSLAQGWLTVTRAKQFHPNPKVILSSE